MKNKWSCAPMLRPLPISWLCGLGFAALLLAAAPEAAGGTPEWLRAAARMPLAEYPPETKAVQLLDEQMTTVREDGEIRTTYRRAFKILRPAGRRYGTFTVYFDNETRLTFLKAWCIPAKGDDFEVKEKDAIETGLSSSSLYDDAHRKILSVPAAEPGNVVGYEFEQRRRPFVFQDKWMFQDPLPVRMARFGLQLPKGWEFKTIWMNYPTQQPRQSGENSWLWEVENVAAVEDEPSMPDWRAVAGWLAISYYPREINLRVKAHASWGELGTWYTQLAADRRVASPDMKRRAAELTAMAPTLLEKIQALAHFVQKDIRYVAIEIGIGGYQPHSAQEIFSNRYGDCKDKVTLLSAMLKEIGIDSYYVLVHSERGVVARDFASMLNFNHVILAVGLPRDVSNPTLYALSEHPRLGRLLYFDPTSELTSFGDLPSSLQASRGLLVTDAGGELIDLPLLPPVTNRLLRVGNLKLSTTGALSGTVQEIRWGAPAASRRAQLLEVQGAERRKVLENFLGGFLSGFTLQSVEATNLEKIEDSLVLRYGFVAENYAKQAGNLLLLRPRVLGQKSTDVVERKERKQPVEFSNASLETDIYEITLPGGFKVDELPPPMDIDAGFAEYHSKVEVEGNILRYKREYKVKDVLVPASKQAEMKKFFRTIAGDERNTAVLTYSAR